MAKKKSPYGKYTAEQYQKHLGELEVLYGSQRKAAEKIGISTSTFKRQKAGQAVPKNAAKTNRLYGANKKKIEAPEMQEKIEKKREKTKERKEKTGIRNAIKVNSQSTRSWLADMYSKLYPGMVNQIVGIAPYVKYNGQEKVSVQFTDGFDQDGKPAGTKRAKAWGIYTAFGSKEGEMVFDIGVTDILIGSPLGIMDDIPGTWSITKMNDYLQSKVLGRSDMKGRQKYIMKHYLGYQLY